ncbi:hypothetical protein F2Q68_00019127 [Brassica cretica]|uniref:Uncharacterized protein n=1 Tax=Brassica cretica TaxID=69181 RepID=A0A8S9FXP3_BRACR|nr:hypothetical protein F2Q68_00019127 [Brassica cretica]
MALALLCASVKALAAAEIVGEAGTVCLGFNFCGGETALTEMTRSATRMA